MITGGRPLLLDLFCGAGGCSRGYQEAGFVTYGVDLSRQKHYIGDWFVQMDALEFMRRLIAGETMPYGLRLADVAAIHASPPCQKYSAITPEYVRASHPDLISPIRKLLKQSGGLFVIENVEGAIRQLEAPIVLCGMCFGLKTYRHRCFESNIMLMAPPHWPHRDNAKRGTISRKGFVTVTGGGMTTEAVATIADLGFDSGLDYRKFAMGVDWMTRDELSQSIPPAYTRYIGAQLLDYLARAAD